MVASANVIKTKAKDRELCKTKHTPELMLSNPPDNWFITSSDKGYPQIILYIIIGCWLIVRKLLKKSNG